MVDRHLRAVVTAEALAWFVRNRGGGLSTEERVAFGAWLRSSPLHIEEYLRTAVTSKNLQAAITALPADAAALLAGADTDDDGDVVLLYGEGSCGVDTADDTRAIARARRTRPLWLAAAALALLALAGATAIWLQRDGQRFDLPKKFETAHGEQRSWLLPDGSGLSLNSDSAVIVRYGRRERVVEVERGQALFQVAHERARRFQVTAGHTTVIAVGTEFDVLRSAGATVVTVVQGRVAVFTGNVPPPSTTAVLPARALSVSAGQQVRIDNLLRTVAPPLVVEANVEQTVAWVQHQITFDRQPLGEVVDEFSRYSSVPIVVESSRLRALPISGVLNEYDTDSFLAFIAKLGDVRITRLGDRIVVAEKRE